MTKPKDKKPIDPNTTANYRFVEAGHPLAVGECQCMGGAARHALAVNEVIQGARWAGTCEKAIFEGAMWALFNHAFDVGGLDVLEAAITKFRTQHTRNPIAELEAMADMTTEMRQ